MNEKKNRHFRTLEELEEEYNEEDHNLKDELKAFAQNIKSQIFSMWGLLVLSMLTLAILSSIVR